jgi:hypothetical protein
MKDAPDELEKGPEPAAEPPPNSKVPPASETWVEGQPTSDADYKEPPDSDE